MSWEQIVMALIDKAAAVAGAEIRATRTKDGDTEVCELVVKFNAAAEVN